MDAYAPYHFHIDGYVCPACAANSVLALLLNDLDGLPADANLPHVSPQVGHPALSQDQVLHFDASIPPRPQSDIWASASLTQEGVGPAPIPSEFNVSGSFQNVPAPTQPPIMDHSDTFLAQPTQEDDGPVLIFDMSGISQQPLQTQPLSLGQSQVFLAHQETSTSQVHDTLQVVFPSLPQSQAAQPGVPTDIAPQVCPLCKKDCGRIQERDRHLRTLLPYRLFCPSDTCSWRGDRYYELKKHWKVKHADSALPTQKNCKIYNPDPLVKLIIRGLSTKSAAEKACSEVKERERELGKVGVWKGAWGRRRVTCYQ